MARVENTQRPPSELLTEEAAHPTMQSSELAERKKMTQPIMSARPSKLNENSNIGLKAKVHQNLIHGNLNKVASSREFGRELITNNSSTEVTSLPAFGKQKSIVSATQPLSVS